MTIKIINIIMYKIILFFLIILSFITSCNSEKSKHKQRMMNNITYDLIPYSPDIKQKKVCTFKFILSEEKNKGKISEWYKPDKFNKLLFYINTQISKDFILKQGNKDSSPAMIYFEPNHQITNKLVFLVAFDKINLDDETYFEFSDNLFNNGKIKFTLDKTFNI